MSLTTSFAPGLHPQVCARDLVTKCFDQRTPVFVQVHVYAVYIMHNNIIY